MKKKKAPVEEPWTDTSENWVDTTGWDALMEDLNAGWEKVAEWPPLELPPMEDPWTALGTGCKDDVESAKPRQSREDAILTNDEAKTAAKEQPVPVAEILLQDLSTAGVVIEHDEKYINEFNQLIMRDPLKIDFFQQYGLFLIFFFDPQKQPDQWKKAAGMAVKHAPVNVEDGQSEQKTFWSVGLSTSTLEKGEEHVIQVWYHEAAHILRGGSGNAHDKKFYKLLDTLINNFNQANGTAWKGHRE